MQIESITELISQNYYLNLTCSEEQQFILDTYIEIAELIDEAGIIQNVTSLESILELLEQEEYMDYITSDVERMRAFDNFYFELERFYQFIKEYRQNQ